MIEFGKALGLAVEVLIAIVAASTFYRWCRDEKSGKKKQNTRGGQRKSREIRGLVLEIAKITGFGYTRIIGDLRKLGIKGVSRQTVRNILKEAGVSPHRIALPTNGRTFSNDIGTQCGVWISSR